MGVAHVGSRKLLYGCPDGVGPRVFISNLEHGWTVVGKAASACKRREPLRPHPAYSRSNTRMFLGSLSPAWRILIVKVFRSIETSTCRMSVILPWNLFVISRLCRFTRRPEDVAPGCTSAPVFA